MNCLNCVQSKSLTQHIKQYVRFIYLLAYLVPSVDFVFLLKRPLVPVSVFLESNIKPMEKQALKTIFKLMKQQFLLRGYIHLFNKYLLDSYCALDTNDIGEASKNDTEVVICSLDPIFQLHIQGCSFVKNRLEIHRWRRNQGIRLVYVIKNKSASGKRVYIKGQEVKDITIYDQKYMFLFLNIFKDV